jgi:hypothetical protein
MGGTVIKAIKLVCAGIERGGEEASGVLTVLVPLELEQMQIVEEAWEAHRSETASFFRRPDLRKLEITGVLMVPVEANSEGVSPEGWAPREFYRNRIAVLQAEVQGLRKQLEDMRTAASTMDVECGRLRAEIRLLEERRG